MSLEVHEHESRKGAGGVAIGGLVTGIAGAGLSLLAILKEMFGSKGINASGDMLSSAVGVLLPVLGTAIAGNGGSNKLNEVQAELARVTAERYADQIGLRAVNDAAAARFADMKELKDGLAGRTEWVNARFREVYQEEVAQRERISALEIAGAKDKEIAKLESQLMEARLNGRIDKLEGETKLGFQQLSNDLAVESERRANGDLNIREWASCTFVPYKKVIDSTQLCPPVRLADGAPSNATQTTILTRGAAPTVQ